MLLSLVVIGWLYVVVMMSIAEAMATNGTVLGAVFTFLLYGLGPIALVVYLMLTPARRRRLRAKEEADRAQARAQATAAPEAATATPGSGAPDAGREAPGDAVAPVRKEP
ncbi:MAG: hypothetical protein EOO24_31955 [Comamonadaceae bacterium]|nr:MAG: hypothetical protein EOO24_31955 [Comamonadaceae bacterium]